MNDTINQQSAPNVTGPALQPHPMLYDRHAKSVFEHPAMVNDFLDWRYGDALAEQLDTSQLAQTSAEYVAADGTAALVDSAWLVPAKTGDKALEVLFEFQWSVDPMMTMRIHKVEGLAVERARRKGGGPEARPPVAVLSVVLHLGSGKWTAKQSFLEAGITPTFIEEIDRQQPASHFEAVELSAIPPSALERLDNFFVALVRLMQCETRNDALRELCSLDELWRAREEPSLGKEIGDLAVVVLRGRGMIELATELRGLLRDARITDRRLEEMLNERELFPRFMAKDLAKLDAAHAEGRAKGRAEGLAEGSVEGGRNLLIGLCRSLHGEDCASSLAELLEHVDSIDVLSAVSRGLIQRGSADEFLAHVRAQL